MSDPHHPPLDQPAPTIFQHNWDGTIDILCRPCGIVLVKGFNDSAEQRQIVKAHRAGGTR